MGMDDRCGTGLRHRDAAAGGRMLPDKREERRERRFEI